MAEGCTVDVQLCLQQQLHSSQREPDPAAKAGSVAEPSTQKRSKVNTSVEVMVPKEKKKDKNEPK